jgi:RHS repeat-associated protein
MRVRRSWQIHARSISVVVVVWVVVLGTLSLRVADAQEGPPTSPVPAAPVPEASGLTAADGFGFHSLVPARLLDSRTPTGGFGGKLAAGANKDLTVAGQGGVPGSATAVIMNVTATGATAGSFVTVFPKGGSTPNASNLNFGVGQTIPNLVTVKLGVEGKVTFANAAGAVDVVADVVGYFDDATGPGDSFFGLPPARILDSRTPVGGFGGKIGAGVANIKDLAVRGQGGVPESATAAVLNVTSTNATAGSFLQVWPSGATRPNSSSLNFGPGETIPNLVVAQIGANGKVSFYNHVGATDVVADVVAYFDATAGPRFHPLSAPTRILDDRVGNGLNGPWGPDQTRVLPVVGRAGIPVQAAGVVLNATVTNGTAGSFVSVYPNGATRPISTNLNFGPGQTIPNAVMVQLPGSGAVAIYNQLGTVDIIADAVGYFSVPQTDVIPPDPTTTAPANDPTEPTDLAEQTKFLYSGPNPVQTFVSPGAIDPERSTVIRGRVRTRDGAALAGVRVTAPDHPELGRTVTRNDGAYDFVVNGGTAAALQYQKPGFLPAQRHAPASEGELTTVDDVVLIPLDTTSTVVAGNSGTVQSAQSSAVTDSDGTRHNTLVFPAGTTAKMRMPDGSLQDLGAMTVRATEYTVGDNGPNAMPGELPPNSGYTYAVELSVDEALAAGATSVEFNQPVADYVENFVGFPVGMKVPSGTYDRSLSQWTATPNGVVVKIVSITAGRADLDVSGDGAADSGSALSSLGINDAERTTLAVLFTTGTSLVRVPISHFSPFDFNWPERCDGCTSPEQEGVEDPSTEEDSPTCTMPGSIIGCEDQTLGERIPIAGTPLALSHNSRSVAAFKPGADVKIPVTGPSVPPLDGIQVVVDVAGRRFPIAATTAPNQTVAFHWDGLDAYGRPVVGAARAVVRVTYVYLSRYASPRDLPTIFGSPGVSEIAPVLNRDRLVHFSSTSTALSLSGARRPGSGVVGGWGIDQHHDWDRAEGKLYLGTGEIRTVAASTGPVRPSNIAATAVTVDRRSGAQILGSGAQIKRRAVNGSVTVLAGNGGFCLASPTPCDEGAVASTARLNPQQQIAIGPDGVVVFVDGTFCNVVNGNLQCAAAILRQIGLDGRIRTIAGNGGHCSDPESCGDGVPATSIPVTPSRIAIDHNGTVWIAELSFGARIRSIDKAGIIRTQYGCLGDCFGIPRPVDGSRAFPAQMNIVDIASAPNGDLVVLEGGNAGDRRRVLAIDPAGIVHVLAGGASQCAVLDCGDRGPARDFAFDSPLRLAVDGAGAIFVEQFESSPGRGPGYYVYRFVPGGIIERVAGSAGQCFTYQPGQCGDGGLALVGVFNGGEIAAGDRGRLYWTQNGTNQMRDIGPEPQTPDGLLVVPSDSGDSLYLFDADGRHVRTVDGLSGVAVLSFGYDAAGRLITITDRDGQITTVQRAANGDPTGIVSPKGMQTALTLDGAGHLASVVRPGANTTSIVTAPNGLLASITFPGSATHSFLYDSEGRLTKDTAPGNGFTQLARSTIPDGTRVTATTADGHVTKYDTTVGEQGVRVTTVTGPTGSVNTSTVLANGSRTTTHADGSTTALVFGNDPRWGLAVPVVTKATETLPGGITSTTTFERSFVPDPTDISKVVSQTKKVTVNGRQSTSVYTASTRTIAVTSPTGQVQTSVFDAENHLVSSAPSAGVTPTTFTYAADGLLTKEAQGTRSAAYEYDALGRRTAQVDAAGRRIATTYDARNFVTSRSSADPASPYAFGNDPRGNVVTLATPGGPGSPGSASYTMTYDKEDQLVTSDVPGSGVDTNTYSLDGLLTQVSKASGATIGRTLDPGGRLTDEIMPAVSTHITYGDATDRATTATWTGSSTQALAFSYQGRLVNGIDMSGAATASFSHTWSDDEWLTSIALSGGPTENLAYDGDGKLVTDGPFSIGRAGPGRARSSISDGTAQHAFGYDAFGSTNDRSLVIGPTSVFRQQLTRDDTGRVSTSTITTPSGTHTSTYTYDAAGRLGSVKKDNGPAVNYTYDSHGNLTNPSAGAASYNSTDQVTAVGATAYTYDSNGNLTGRGSDTFTYDARGELLAATVGGTTVQYTYDALQRRVARVEGGAKTEYLYGDPRQPLRVTASRQGGVLTYYFYDDSGRPFAFERAGQRFYLGSDAVGTTRIVRNGDGTTVKEIDVDVWGNVLADSNPGFALDLGFAGGMRDRVTGFVRFGVRDYDPVTGRFVSPDPTGFAIGYHRYAYAGDDPINSVDPAGTGSIGAEYYELVGGGFELSWGSNGWTVCVLIGFGVGGSFSAENSSTTANAAGGGASFSASEGGPGSEVGSSVDYFEEDCGNTSVKASLDGRVGPFQAKLGLQGDNGGNISDASGLSNGTSFGPNNHVGLQLRAAGKKCWHWGEAPPA